MTEKRAVSVERVIAASPDAIFDVLADPRRHAGDRRVGLGEEGAGGHAASASRSARTSAWT